MFANISFAIFLLLQSTFLPNNYARTTDNNLKTTSASLDLRFSNLSDKNQIEILSIPSLRIVRIYKKSSFISNSIWELITELRENIDKFNSNADSDTFDVLHTYEFNELHESLQKLQKKLIQEFDIGIPLLVPGINKYKFDSKATESWIFFNINKLLTILSKIDDHSFILQKSVIGHKNKTKIKQAMLEISDRIQYILVWFQIHAECSYEEPNLYFMLTEYFNNIELLSLKDTVESSILFCHDIKFTLKINTIKKIIEEVNPYIPINKYNSLLKLKFENSSNMLELIKLFNKKTQILKFKFENNFKEYLKDQEIDISNLELLDFIIDIYQNLDNLYELLEQLIRKPPSNENFFEN
ncbi:hypothetical protein FG386_002447 [Cryptosporidium ryanae]|uniref:uncharacterized protein n=1 Tax=Cryptosporidium ryanae TaxID=515981 RepID=UPI00351A4CD1|nr:hypothetical protein FG386_002447 [Cryptosporidium ryanae]